MIITNRTQHKQAIGMAYTLSIYHWQRLDAVALSFYVRQFGE